MDDYEIDSDLTSISSSVYNYEYENGRMYHAYRSGSYVLPNDEREQGRLDILHHVFRLTLNGEPCWTRPVNPQKILDVGTGTGIWAIEIGDEFPSAEVIGTDLSPIQPHWVPPNVRFVVDDASERWPFPEGSFDFIHVRGLAGSIRNWPAFLKECLKHLKPGGRIELSEARNRIQCDDGTYPEDCHTRMWMEEFNRISHEQNTEFDMFPSYRDLLHEAGFDAIDIREELCPIGAWPKDRRLKEIGEYYSLQFIEAALDSYSLALFTRFGGWSKLEVQVLLARVRKELRSNKMHLYTHCSYAIAQKAP